MYSLIFYSSLFTFQNSPSKCQHWTTNGVWHAFFCFVANFNRKTIIPFPLSERYMKPSELKLVDGIHLFWLQLSLSFVIQIYLLILASSPLFLLDRVIQISQQRLSPGAPYHPSPRTIDGTQEKSTLSCFAFVCFELAAVYWEFCGSGRRWFTGWSWEAGQRPPGPSLYTTLNQEKSISLQFESNKTICLTLMYQKVCTKSKDWGNSDLTKSTKYQKVPRIEVGDTN